jgi:signal transduction histidine kinase
VIVVARGDDHATGDDRLAIGDALGDRVATLDELAARLDAARYDAVIVSGDGSAAGDVAALAAIAAVRARASAMPVVAVAIADADAAVTAGALDVIADGEQASLARRLACAVRLGRAEAHAATVTAVRDEVLAIVTHDLRSPLNAISLACEALSEDPTPEQRTRYVAAIRRASGRSDKLLRDLLEVTLIEGGGLALALAPVALAPLVEEIRCEYDAATRERTIELSVQLDPAAVAVSADRDRLRQVLGVLLANVVKFAPGGAATITSRADGDWIELAVRDRGPGFPPQALAGATQPFWRPGPARRSGVGIGLAIARGIVGAHGGTLQVENVADGGARVAVRLPRAAA